MSFLFREGTTDSLIFEEIFKYDGYQLPDQFSENDIIIDIGAHLGFFTYAVLQRGARNVYAFEPDTENYNLAVENLKDYIDQNSVFLTQSAVWRSDVNERVLYYGGYVSDTNLVNTGAGDVIWHKKGNLVSAIPFDTVVLNATKKATRRIRLLKLDCEGSEWPILFTSNTIHLINEICGEFHEIGGEYDTYTPPFSIEGFDRFTIHDLVKLLKEKNFDVTYSRALKADGTPSHLGRFFATRAIPGSMTKNVTVRIEEKDYPLPAGEAPIQYLRQAGQEAGDRTLLRVFAGYVGWVRSVAFSPDGNKVLTGSSDGTARLWEAANGRLLATLQGHTNVVESVAFSPDGGKVLTGSYDGTARLWETASGRLLATLQGHTNVVVSVAFSPDGSKMLTGSSDRTARLWETASGRLLATLQGHTNVVVSVAFSPDGSKMLTGSYDGTVRLWEAASGRLITTVEGYTNVVESVAFSPDGNKVLTGSSDGTARLWEAASGRLLATLQGHTGWVVSVVFSPDGSKMLTGSYDGTARLWETAKGRLLIALQGHKVGVESVAFSPDGNKVLTGSSDGTARLWEAASGRLLATLQGHAGWVVSVAFSPDGGKVLTGSYDGTARLWETANGRLLATLQGSYLKIA